MGSTLLSVSLNVPYTPEMYAGVLLYNEGCIITNITEGMYVPFESIQSIVSRDRNKLGSEKVIYFHASRIPVTEECLMRNASTFRQAHVYDTDINMHTRRPYSGRQYDNWCFGYFTQ